MNSENRRIGLETAKKNLEYAINLYNCLETPLDEKIIEFAEQDKTATAYRNLALQSLKGENVDGYIFTAKNSALDRIYHWRAWIREYEAGYKEGSCRKEMAKTESIALKAQETALEAIDMGLTIEQAAKLSGLSISEVNSLEVIALFF